MKSHGPLVWVFLHSAQNPTGTLSELTEENISLKLCSYFKPAVLRPCSFKWCKFNIIHREEIPPSEVQKECNRS